MPQESRRGGLVWKIDAALFVLASRWFEHRAERDHARQFLK